MKRWLLSMSGIGMVFASLWGGAFGYHLTNGTWAEWPCVMTAILLSAWGIFIFGCAIDDDV